MYTPSYIKKENQYTEGEQFMLDGEEYTGYYNINANGAFTDRVFTGKSKRLYVLEYVENEASQLYIQLAESKGIITDQEFDDPNHHFPSYDTDDLLRGYIVRFFIKQRNDINGRIREINKEQFKLLSDTAAGLNPDFYKAVSMKWKIKGPREDVMNGNIILIPGVIGTNRRSLREVNHDLPGILQHLEYRLTQYTVYALQDDNTNTDIQL